MTAEQLLHLFETREPDPLGFVYFGRALVWQLEALMGPYRWPHEWEWDDWGTGKVRIGRDTLKYRIGYVREDIALRAKSRLIGKAAPVGRPA